MSKEIAQKQTPIVPGGIAPLSPIEQIAQLKEMGVGVAEMRELLELQKDHQKNLAHQAFNDAVAAFKSENIVINKDRNVSYGTTSYQHSSLSNILETIMPHLGVYGLSHKWLTDQSDGKVKVTCVLSHRDGHSEQTSLESAPDTSGGKNSIQGIASAVKYLERYTLTALLGLAEKDQFDDDGQAVESTLIDADQVKRIKALLAESKANANHFLNWLGIDRVEDMPDKIYTKAVMMLQKKIEAQKGGDS